MTTKGVPLLVMGATGRIGRALHAQGRVLSQAGLQPIWQSRRPEPGFLTWDILNEPCPEGAARGVVLCLAGVIRGTAEELAQNEALALAACKAATEQGGRHVFLVSSAAVYASSAGILGEDAALAPPGEYGAAKLAMERAAFSHPPVGSGLTILRIGNISGFDMLLGGLNLPKPALLDPVVGQPRGPVRSYIGPVTLAHVLARLMGLAAKGVTLPPVLNIATAPPVSMADLLDAAGADWGFGEVNPKVIPRVELDVSRLKSLVDIAPEVGHAAAMVAEWRGLAG